MAKGKARRFYPGAQGIVQSQTGPDYSYLYRASTVRDPAYWVGYTVDLPDRRQYVYSKSSAACLSNRGAEFTQAGYVSYTSVTTSVAVGKMEVTVPAATHATLTEDFLRGGYLTIFMTGGNTQFRGIVGNQAVAANAAFKLQLDAELSEAVTTSEAMEVFQNPYNELRTGTMNYYAKAGVPAVDVTAADTYFWLQTRGMIFADPQGGKIGTTEGGYIGGLWSDYGNISDYNTSLGVTVAGGRGSQHAGHAVLGDADNIGPLFMLQG